MKVSVRFVNDNGQETLAVFDQATGTVSAADGRTGAFTRAEGSRTIELKGDEQVSITFAEDPRIEVGASMRYSTSDGRAGVATVMSIE